MPERRVLLLDSNHLHAYHGAGDSVRLEKSFRPDEEGHADFRIYLQQHQKSLFYLLTDLPEESFQIETLPFVRGADRESQIKRKLNQYFFGTPFTLSKSLGRRKDGRRDEKFMFAALTRPQALEPWLLAVEETGAALAGIYSTPLVLPALLDRASAAAEHLILMTLTPGGLRQSYFEYGQLRFSRLSPLATNTIEEAAVAAAGEAAKIHQYLVGQRLLARGQKVPVLCLANAADQKVLARACSDTDELTFRYSEIWQAAAAIHLHTAVSDSHVDLLLVHLLLKKPGVEQFADAGARQHYRRWQLRTSINAASLAVIALIALLSAKVGIGFYFDGVDAEEAAAAVQVEQRRYDALVKSLPQIPVTPTHLRALIAAWNELDLRSPGIVASLAELSRVLDTQPQVELMKLDWRLGPTPDTPPALGSSLASSLTLTGKQDKALYLIVDVEAQLPQGLASDRRAQSELVDRFVAQLALLPGTQARVLQRPFDTAPEKSLKGSTDGATGPEKLNFTVRYWRKVAA